MKTKLEKMLISAQIGLDWMLIKAFRKKAKKYFSKGGNFFSKRSMYLYNRLQSYSEHVMVLMHRYEQLTKQESNSDRNQFGAVPTLKKS